MTRRRWLSIVCVLAGSVLTAQPAQAQLSLPPAGPSGGGFAGSNSGGYGASVPLDLPGAHGGLPIPVQITYSEHGVGAAGRGWDVPLSYIRDDTTVTHRRPVGTPNVAPAPREQVSLVLGGRSTDLVPVAGGWIARNDDAQLQVQQSNGSWVAYDGQGRTYTFAQTSALAGTGIWLLQDITASGGGKVHLDYVVATPTVSGNPAISIDLTRVSYNPSPGNANCFKNAVQLNYDKAADPPVSISVIGTKLLVRQHTLRDPAKPPPDPNKPTTSAVDILAADSCPAGGAAPTYVRLRHYEFAYAADGDTGQTRLQEVRIFGRDGTAEANASSSIPLAKFSYGTAIAGGQLNYGSTVRLDSASSLSLSNLALMQPTTAVLQGFGSGVHTAFQLVDVTGDGRPDVVSFSSGQLTVRASYSTTAAYGFGPSRTLSDSTLSPKAPETQTTQAHLPPSATVSHNRVWRRAMDVNGDGRIDIIDAAEQSGHWVVYLNTPDAADPTTVKWQRRSFPIAKLGAQLAALGMTENGFVPLSRTAIASRGQWGKCWQWNNQDQSWEDVTGVLDCGGSTSLLTVDDEYIEWDLKDLNGDGYPDVVFNSKQVVASVHRSIDIPPHPAPNTLAYTLDDYSVGLKDGTDNTINAMFNVIGTRLIDNGGDIFSSAVTIMNHDDCGVERWAGDSDTARHMACGIADVNGDGIVDRVSGVSVFLGIGVVDGSGFFTASATMSLPGPLANETNNIIAICKGGGTSFASEHKARLVDLTGDGIPDYVTATGSGTGWGIFVGTGAGFTGSIPITAGFALGVNTESCNSTVAGTSAGLADIDGDGRPELLNAQHQLLSITGSDGLAGAPSAGRLIGVDNEFGAKINVHYRSIKGDTTAMHQVPYAEIVVDSVDTSNTNGSRIGATFYAYGGAELFFDPARDSFIFPGYRRTITLADAAGAAGRCRRVRGVRQLCARVRGRSLRYQRRGHARSGSALRTVPPHRAASRRDRAQRERRDRSALRSEATARHRCHQRLASHCGRSLRLECSAAVI
jgi:VCBS repeat protein